MLNNFLTISISSLVSDLLFYKQKKQSLGQVLALFKKKQYCIIIGYDKRKRLVTTT